MTFSIYRSDLPIFSKQSWDCITLELERFDDESVWEIDWDGEFSVTFPDGDCWIIDSWIVENHRNELESYISANQAAIDKQADDQRDSDRADYEYGNYLEERGM